mmetsp:Transcript_96561/g.306342  ORF Transcript_96561/g.306342 Transcript_96561/m.306342 type:complete len:224 (+) Transcript_96561:559-1230(+)
MQEMDVLAEVGVQTSITRDLDGVGPLHYAVEAAVLVVVKVLRCLQRGEPQTDKVGVGGFRLLQLCLVQLRLVPLLLWLPLRRRLDPETVCHLVARLIAPRSLELPRHALARRGTSLQIFYVRVKLLLHLGLGVRRLRRLRPALGLRVRRGPAGATPHAVPKLPSAASSNLGRRAAPSRCGRVLTTCPGIRDRSGCAAEAQAGERPVDQRRLQQPAAEHICGHL